MTRREQMKEESLNRILAAALARLRIEGLAGAAIAPVMNDAGLTHGAFYSHFRDKDALAEGAFRHGFVEGRPRWIGKTRDRLWSSRLKRLADWYLRPGHRDDRANGCSFSALATDAARAPDSFRLAYTEELRKSLEAICDCAGDGPNASGRHDEAIFLMAVCVGGLTLSRAVADPGLSDRILKVCRDGVSRFCGASGAAGGLAKAARQ